MSEDVTLCVYAEFPGDGYLSSEVSFREEYDLMVEVIDPYLFSQRTTWCIGCASPSDRLVRLLALQTPRPSPRDLGCRVRLPGPGHQPPVIPPHGTAW